MCICKIIIIGSDNSLSPGRRQAIIWTNAGILLIVPLGTNFSEILIEIDTFSFKKMHLKMSSENGGHLVSASMCERWLSVNTPLRSREARGHPPATRKPVGKPVGFFVIIGFIPLQRLALCCGSWCELSAVLRRNTTGSRHVDLAQCFCIMSQSETLPGSYHQIYKAKLLKHVS